MKIAALYTGFIRTQSQTFENHKYWIDKYNPDIYISTWDTEENGAALDINLFNVYGNNFKNIVITNKKNYDDNKIYFKPIERDNDVFITNKRAYESNIPYGGPSYWVNRILDQWYVVMKGFESIKNLNNYDLIVRLRFDTLFTKFNLESTNTIIVPFSPAEHLGQQIFNDHMAYGTPFYMKKYSELYNHLNEIYVNNNIDVSYAEIVHKFYLENYVSKDIARTSEIMYQIQK